MSSKKMEDYIELSYKYGKVGSAFDLDHNQAQSINYDLNVTMMFTWHVERQMYEVDYYASSPTVDYVESPSEEELKADVYRDLRKKGINLDYIPDVDEWGL